MKKQIVLMVIALPVVGLLGGCALLGLGPRQPQITAQSTLPMGADAFVRFEQGRAALDAGLNAEAIAAFSEARLEPYLLAPSLNGMAVAYARLGRLDLAERYFMQAVAAAPQDVRFTANLAHLQQTLRGMEEEYRPPVLAAAAPAPVRAAGPARTIQAGNGIVRLVTQSGGAVRVASAPTGNRIVRINPAEVQLSAAVTETPRNGARVRIRFEDGAAPVVASAAAADSSHYPIRVTFRQ
jgi:tetratricopeptide (TPR) repeat protein